MAVGTYAAARTAANGSERYERQLPAEMATAYREIDWLAERMEEDFFPIERQMEALRNYVSGVPVTQPNRDALMLWAWARVHEQARRVGRVGTRNGRFMIQRPRVGSP